MWDELKAVSDAWIASQVPEPIKVRIFPNRDSISSSIVITINIPYTTTFIKICMRLSSYQIYLPDGRQIDGLSWRTTPFDVASEISKGPAEKSIVAKVNGEMWDLERPLEKSSHVQILGPGDAEAQVS